MKNILILSNCELVESQGSGYIIVNTARVLTEMGHQVDIIPPSQLSLFPSLKSSAVVYRMAFGMLRWVISNKKRILGYKLIIFYGGECVLALYFIKKILGRKIPILLHSNGLEVHVDYRLESFRDLLPVTKRRWYHLNLSKLFKYCYNNVDSILTLSKYDRDFAIGHLNVKAEKIHYLEPCLPNEFFSYQSKNLPQKKKIITFCGTWIIRKGIDAIKIAIPDVLRSHPDYIFRIIGPGHNFIAADHFPQDILDKIEVFPLVQSKNELISLYSESSIFLFPSFCESFGLVVAETMFCKCAVICGPTGIAADLKNNEEAIILDSPTAPLVYQALEKLLNDESLIKQLGDNAYLRIQNLKWENYRDKMNKIVEKITSNVKETVHY